MVGRRLKKEQQTQTPAELTALRVQLEADCEALQKIKHGLVTALKRMILPYLHPCSYQQNKIPLRVFVFEEARHRDPETPGGRVFDATRSIAGTKNEQLQYLTGFYAAGVIDAHAGGVLLTPFVSMSTDDLLILTSWMCRNWLKEVELVEKHNKRLDAITEKRKRRKEQERERLHSSGVRQPGPGTPGGDGDPGHVTANGRAYDAGLVQ